MSGERTLPGLGLYGFWTLGSNLWKDQNDSNLLKLSSLVQAKALDFVPFTPGSPSNGDIYILDAGVDINKIIVRDNGAWTYFTPEPGWLFWVESDPDFYIFDGTNWSLLKDVLGVTPLPGITTGDGLKVVRVKSDESGFELAAAAGGGDVVGPSSAVDAAIALFDGTTGKLLKEITDAAFKTRLALTGADIGIAGMPFERTVALSDETTALTTGTAKAKFRMPHKVTLTAVRASVNVAPTGGTLLTVNVKESGATIFSTKLTFDASAKTTVGATTPAVISDASLADDAEISFDIDNVGSTVAGAGLKVTLLGVYAV